MNRVTRFVVHRVGHRGAALLFFALLDGVYAFSLLQPPAGGQLNASLAFMQNIAPFPVWGALWASAGVVCLASTFLVNDRWGFAAAMLIKVLWGVLYVYGALVGVDRAYLGAVVWLCLAGWVGVIASWPEPPTLEE